MGRAKGEGREDGVETEIKINGEPCTTCQTAGLAELKIANRAKRLNRACHRSGIEQFLFYRRKIQNQTSIVATPTSPDAYT